MAKVQMIKGYWSRMTGFSFDLDDRFRCSRCGNIVHYKNKSDLYTFNRWCGRCGSDNAEKEEEKVIKAIKNDTQLPNNVTNGDVIGTLFPTLKVRSSDCSWEYKIEVDGISFQVLKSWWDELYRKE